MAGHLADPAPGIGVAPMARPFRRAIWAIGVMIVLVLAGFYPAYWSRLSDVPWTLHLHGLSASAWVIVLLAQATSIRWRRKAFHRALGLSSLALFPCLTAGLAASLTGVSYWFARGDSFYAVTGPPFVIGFAVSLVALCHLVGSAFRPGYSRARHAACMLATLLIMVQAPLTRLLVGLVPGFGIASEADFANLVHAGQVATASSALVGIGIAWRYGAAARPFLWASFWLAAQTALVILFADSALVGTILRGLADWPIAVGPMAGAAAGAIISAFALSSSTSKPRG